MKHIIIILISFSLLLISCSYNQVTLTMRDGAKIESELLSVRDSSIVIQEKGGAPIAIPNEQIEYVMQVAGSPVPSIVGCGGFGAAFGLVVGFFFTTTECSLIYCEEKYPGALPGTLIGAGVGTIIGVLSAPKDRVFILSSKSGRESLKDYSKYHNNEPDALKKIK